MSVKIAIQQRVLPLYRHDLFRSLADMYAGNLEICAGEPAEWEGITASTALTAVPVRAVKNIHIGKNLWYGCWQKGVLAWLRDWNPSLVVFEANPRLLSNMPAIKALKKKGVPVIGWGLGVLEHDMHALITNARRKWLQLFYTQFDLMIAYSNKGAHDYIAMGIPASRVRVVANAVANIHAYARRRDYKENSLIRETWKTNIGVSGPPTLLFVGRLIKEKRVDVLIRACAHITTPFHLMIVGDGPERSPLEALAAEILPATKFVGEKRDEELSYYFASADVFVLPGSGGLALQEAMAYGLPVIVGSGDGTQNDLVQERINGMYVQEGSVTMLAEKIQACLDDRGLRLRMGTMSKDVVAKKHNIESMIRQFKEALDCVQTRI